VAVRPESDARTAAARRGHWRGNLAATAALLAVWAVATFAPIYWARNLDRIEFLGWPLAYYMAAQGTLLVYLALVWLYAGIMDRMDRRYHAGRRGR
jgi:putative solute:sodium symporter small subunit